MAFNLLDNVKIQSEMKNKADESLSSNVTTLLYERLKVRAELRI